MSTEATAQKQVENRVSEWYKLFGVDPSSLWTSGFDAWAQMTKENFDRMQSFYDELADMETASYDRAKQSAREVGSMMGETVSYLADMTREWRRLSIEATKRSAQILHNK